MPDLVAQFEVRILRGLELWQTYRGRLEVDEDGWWLVPSGSEVGLLHRVSLEADECGCDDHRYTHLRCKHIWAAIFEVALGLVRPEIRFAADPYSADAPGAPRRRPR